MTIEEELVHLEDNLRKLKIEYDIYFNGGKDRPPWDLHWRVEGTIKKYNDNARLSFAQRFKFNALMQRFAVYNDMWRQKVKIKEEGRDPRKQREEPRAAAPPDPANFRVQWHDPEQEGEKVEKLFQALVDAKKQIGETADSLPIEKFKMFVKQKTEQLKKDLGCKAVEYSVEVESGQVRLKAKGGS